MWWSRPVDAQYPAPVRHEMEGVEDGSAFNPESSEKVINSSKGKTPENKVINVTMPFTVKKVIRKNVIREYPIKVSIPCVVSHGDVDERIGISKTKYYPISDETLRKAIVDTIRWVTRGYTAQRCTRCEAADFKICNKTFDGTCIFCQISEDSCVFASEVLSRSDKMGRGKRTRSILLPGLPREWLYDANRKMIEHIEGFKMSQGAALYMNCGRIPEDLCLNSMLLDGLHRAASYHSAIHKDWSDDDLIFGKFDSSALIAFGYFAEELAKQQLSHHILPSLEDKLRVRPAKRIKRIKIPELESGHARKEYERDDVLRRRIQKWKHLVDFPPDPSVPCHNPQPSIAPDI